VNDGGADPAGSGARELSIHDEISPLRRVLVHRPGDELVRMTQHQLERLLFDDILAPTEAAREHDLMTDILRAAGAEVLDVSDLLLEALERSSDEMREGLIRRVCELAGASELYDELCGWSPAILSKALICGVAWRELSGRPSNLGRIRRELDSEQFSALPPQPNLMFMRDPCITFGDRVLVGRMATDARAREPLLVAYAVELSGSFEPGRLLFDSDDAHRHQAFRCFEGGDVLVLNRRVLLVGCSVRTSAQTIERVAREALFPTFGELERIYAVMMPQQRSVMHLDTILTHIDEQLFLGHAPLLGGDDNRDRRLPVARLSRDAPAELLAGASVLDVLREELSDEVAVVPCGGKDPLHQEREQWTDGANALCVAPGRFILYARNARTIAELRDHGFEETALHMVQPADERRDRTAEGMTRRTVFSFPGFELSRARGGGRCLTMPLARG
jgi:arginine deiminase